MKKSTVVLSFLLFVFLGVSTIQAQTVDPNAVDGEVYFQLKAQSAAIRPGINGVVDMDKLDFLTSLKETYRITQVSKPFYKTNDPNLGRVYLLKFKRIFAVDSLISKLKKEKDINYAEKAPLFKILYSPNDKYYNSYLTFKWYLKVIHAEQAWDIQKGDPNIKVAIVDNAIDVGHPDLKHKIVGQIDLADGDLNPTPPKKNMDWSHGTHTSGLAGAETDNNIGIASIGFKVSLLAVKVSNDSTDGTTMSYGYQGIVWAADHGANVMNLSWGGPGYYKTGQYVANYAYNKGCVIVASAGNDGNSSVTYPAGYKHVIAVASTDGNDKKSSFSQYGSFVDVCAPGGGSNGFGIYSTVDDSSQQYGYMEGTSMASPIVAGLCGLMLSEDSLLTPGKLKAILKATCDSIDAQNPDFSGQLGAGRINAYAALHAVHDSMVKHSIVADFKASSVSVPEGGNVNFTDLSGATAKSWKWVFEGGNPSQSTVQNPANIYYAKAGSYKVSLTVSDGQNSNTETKTNYILVYPLISGAWLPQATGFSAQSRGINYISIVNPDVVWANAYDGSGKGASVQEFTKTSDGGNTWKPGTYNGVPASYAVSTLSAVSADKAWVAMYAKTAGNGYGGIFTTNDGGLTWLKQPSATFNDPNSFPDVVYFWDALRGVCMGDPINNYFEIYTTSDGGSNWTRVPSANIPISSAGEYGYTNLYTVYGNTIWFGTNKGRVFKSTDQGKHWTAFSTGMPEVTTLGFHNDSVGIATYVAYNSSTNAITDFQMKKSVDGGDSWTTVSPTGNYYKSDMAVVPDAEGLLISTGITQDLATSGSAYSLDEGKTWTQLDDSIQYTSVKFFSSSVGWAGGFNETSSSRGIWKWLGIPTTGVKDIPGNKLNLSIYPNPCFGKLHFITANPERVVEISINDLQGKLVKHFSNNQNRQSREFIIDLTSLKKGVYIAVVKTKRGFTTKKFVLE